MARERLNIPKNSDNKTLDIPIGTQDDLSMVYFLRSKQLQVGHTYAFPVIVKDKCEHVTLENPPSRSDKNQGIGSCGNIGATHLARLSDVAHER